MRMTVEQIPIAPPRLAPGRSASGWARWQLLALIAFLFTFVGGGLLVGIPERTQTQRYELGGPWVGLMAATFLLWILAIVRDRQAAYPERAAGYTATPRG